MSLPFWYPPILAYHRVHPQRSDKTPTISPGAFEKQMAILAQDWKPVPLSAVVDSLSGGAPLPPQAVAITFDDGTEDNFTHAFPILQQYKIPATIFMITGRIGKSGYLYPNHMELMARSSVTFGSHGIDHEYLPSLAVTGLEQTLRESRRTLQNLGYPTDYMSFPGGGYTAHVVNAVRAAGYKGACTTNRGFQRFPPSPWELRRITMHESGTKPFSLWLRCCGWYGLNRSLRAPA